MSRARVRKEGKAVEQKNGEQCYDGGTDKSREAAENVQAVERFEAKTASVISSSNDIESTIDSDNNTTSVVSSRSDAAIIRAVEGLVSTTTPTTQNPTRSADAENDHEGEDANNSNETIVASASIGAIPTARLITEESRALPLATEVQNRRTSRRRGLKNSLPRVCFISMTILLVLIGIILAVVASQLQRNAAPNRGSDVTKEEYLLRLLPNDTRSAINNTDTPQARAFQWLINDTSLSSYPDFRLLQRYALATFYFANTGDTWYYHDRWLDYESHECQWEMSLTYKSFMAIKDYAAANIIDAIGMPPAQVQHVFDVLDRTGLTTGLSASETENPCEENDLDNIGDGVYKHILYFQNNILGTLPPELFLLTSLKSLVIISPNNLYGALDTQIGNLRDLKALVLAMTNIEGTIPTEIGSLSNLMLLGMHENSFTGSLPTEIGKLSQLLYLSFNSNVSVVMKVNKCIHSVSIFAVSKKSYCIVCCCAYSILQEPCRSN